MSSDYCQSIVRANDPDRFLISLFFDGEARGHLWSLYALNYEIAKTRETVTDTHMGLIRLQWWRDALSAFYERNEVAAHDVMRGLSEAVWRYNLPREALEQIIYAREFDLEDRSPSSLEGLCNYADYTHTPLLRLGAMIAGEDPDHPALRPVAMAYALAGLIRAVPFHAAQGRRYLPGAEDAASPDVRPVREKAQELLRQGGATGQGRLIRLHKVVAEQYLNKIKRLGDNPHNPHLAVPPLFREVRLWLAAGKK